jgi:nucleotide-binding universal stress UspA family protein
MSSRSIVCAVDQSEDARRAITVGNDLCHRLGLRLVLARVLRATSVGATIIGRPGEQIARPVNDDDNESAAWLHLRGLAARHDLGGAALRVEIGLPGDVIARIAREEDAELVVTGPPEHRHLHAALLGSLPAGLASAAPCPVVVVPPEATKAPVQDESPAIVCGVDDSERSGEVLRFAATLASLLEARLVVAHIAPIPHWPRPSVVPGAVERVRRGEVEDAENLLAELLAGVPTSSQTTRRVAFGDPGGALADLADEEGAQFVVVGSNGGGSRAAAVLGSVSAELIGSSRIPIVVVPPRVLQHTRA